MASSIIIRQLAKAKSVAYEEKVGNIWKPWNHKIGGFTHMEVVNAFNDLYHFRHAGKTYFPLQKIPLNLKDGVKPRFTSVSARATRNGFLLPHQKLIDVYKHDFTTDIPVATNDIPVMLYLYRASTIDVEICWKRIPSVKTALINEKFD